jgi:hypothetical protein
VAIAGESAGYYRCTPVPGYAMQNFLHGYAGTELGYPSLNELFVYRPGENGMDFPGRPARQIWILPSQFFMGIGFIQDPGQVILGLF